jgi:ABC-type amino acid transport substrate-binding protein
MIGFILTMIGCNGKTDIPGALERINKHKEVRIATYPISPPFEFGKDSGVQGLDIDIGTEIGKAFGFPAKSIKAFQYEQLFEYLKSGEAEIVISAVAIDPKMGNEFSFSHPYYDSWDVLAIQRVKPEIKGLDDLSGKLVGVATGRPADTFLSSNNNISLKKYATLEDALGGLNRAEVDALVGDEPLLVYSSLNYPNTRVRQEAKLDSYQYAAVVRKKDQVILPKINETIDRLKASGEIDKLLETWMGDKRAKVKELISIDDNKLALQESPKKINVAINKSSGAWDPNRLDGFKLVLDGASGRYESTPILMAGNKGNCKFTTAVPPGDYTLNISILNLTAKVPVPRLEKTVLTMDVNIGRDVSILIR